MSQHEEKFRQLLDGIRAGSQDAVREFLERYGTFVLTVIRQKLSVELRPVFDSLDFLQDVWASFFTGEPRQEFHDPKALIAFLARIARGKVAHAVRKRIQGERFNLSRENSLDGSARAAALCITADGPSPSELATSKEEWDRLMKDLPFHHQRILELLRDGHKNEEIAAELGIDEKTVRRLIHKIYARSKS